MIIKDAIQFLIWQQYSKAANVSSPDSCLDLNTYCLFAQSRLWDEWGCEEQRDRQKVMEKKGRGEKRTFIRRRVIKIKEGRGNKGQMDGREENQ